MLKIINLVGWFSRNWTLIATALVAVFAFLLYLSAERMSELKDERDAALQAQEQMLEDLEANRAAVKALSQSYREVYTEYTASRDAIRNRNTDKLLNAEPTTGSQQIKNEINSIFEQIEEEASR